MNIELDTRNKIIRVKGNANLKELFSWLMSNYEFEWETWTITEYPDASRWPDTRLVQEKDIFPFREPMITSSPGTTSVWIGDPISPPTIT